MFTLVPQYKQYPVASVQEQLANLMYFVFIIPVWTHERSWKDDFIVFAPDCYCREP